MIDISVMIGPGLPVYPGDPTPSIRQETSTASGDSVNLSSLSFGLHAGTHLDAPYHVNDRWPAMKEIDLGRLSGPCRVVDLSALDVISAVALRQLDWHGVNRVLFRTSNSRLWSKPYSASDVCPEC